MGGGKAITERDGGCGLWGSFLHLFNSQTSHEKNQMKRTRKQAEKETATMEEKPHHSLAPAEGQDFQTSHEKDQIIRSTRDQKPLHYTLKIQSFSLLKDAVTSTTLSKGGRYESEEFDAGGYKWKLALYPNGDKERNGSDHISLYLVTSEDDVLSSNLEVHVEFTFLVFDQYKDKYLTVRDGKIRRFHSMKTEWGFPQLLPFSTFKDSSNGFLVNDCCVFGVEIFVMKNEGNGEVFSLIKEPKNNKFTWTMQKFSKLHEDRYESDLFTVEGYNWKIRVYPKGSSTEKGRSLSLFLSLKTQTRVYVECEFTIIRQVGTSLNRKFTFNSWFGSEETWGLPNFIALKDLTEPSQSFIVDDVLIVEAKIYVISTFNNLS